MITDENAHPGTTSWQIPPNQVATTQLQAYAGATSVQPGQALTFYVSTQVERTHYAISIYRMGWYRGHGGRLMSKVTDLTGLAQGYYDQIHHHLVDCSSCYIDTKTGLIEANWLPSYTFTVPPTWVTGVYLAKFTDTHGMQTYVPFDIRGNNHSLYIVVTSDTTYAAYNDWGGYSLYRADQNSDNETISLDRGTKVSFDRPYDQAAGSGYVLMFEANAIRWMERQGYDLSYISSVDLHENPAQLLNHRAYLSLGHDEYWTKEMRNGVEKARNQGVGLAFLGANTAYWQMRFEPDSKGNPDRTVVCYKVLTAHNDLANDPLYGKDNSRVTSQWRDPVLARPENALIGIMYSSNTFVGQGYPWRISSLAKSPLLDGTGLVDGHQYGCDIVGYEWDHVFKNGATPAELKVLAQSLVRDDYNSPDFGNTTYYIAPSGAMVFATGSIYWMSALDNYRYLPDKACLHQPLVIPAMQKLMTHIMHILLINHPSL